MNKTKILAHLALLAVALFYGGNYLIAKVVMNGQHIQPLGFVLLRVLAATGLFWLFASFLKSEPIARKDWRVFILCGLTGVAANQSLFFSGLHLTTPIHAALIMTTSPMVVLVFSYLIAKEPVTPKKILGLIIGCIGAVILVTLGQSIETAPQALKGDLLVFLNGSSYALYLVLVKKLTSKYSPFTVVKWVFLFGLLFVTPVGFKQLASVEWTEFSLNIWLAVIYVLVCVTFLAYLLNIMALRRVNPSTVGIYIYLQPLFASVLSVIFIAESLSWPKVVAGILIFIGVYLVSDLQFGKLKKQPVSRT